MGSNVLNPFKFFTDNDGNALDSGFIYVGTVNLNPETSPIQAYWDQEFTIPAAQPVRTVSGYPSRYGTPSQIFVNSDDYSITVRDKNGAIIFNNPAANGIPGLTGDLSNPTDPNKGAALIGRGDQMVINIVDLQALSKNSPSKFASTQGYYVAGDGGHGSYWCDVSDTTSAHNGGSIIVASDGGRWKLLGDRPHNVRQWGAKGDGVTDDTTRIQALVNSLQVTGGDIYFPTGIYIVGNSGLTWTVQTLSLTGYRIGMHGDGPSLSVLRSSGLSFDTNAVVKIIADYATAMNSLVFGVEFANMTFEAQGSIGSAFRHTAQAYGKFDNIDFKGGRWAYFGEGVLTTAYERCRFIEASETGCRLLKGTGFSFPNALTFTACQFANNGKWGMYADNPGGVRVYGGSCESNGASDAVNGGGMVFDHAGATSSGTPVVAVLSGIYFEFNNGRADVYFAHGNSFDNLTMDVFGCSFECGGSMITNDRILIQHTSTSALTAGIFGCNFSELSGFVPTTSQKYIKVTGAGSGIRQVVADGSNYYNNPNSFPDLTASVQAATRANFRVQRTYSAVTNVSGVANVTLDGFTAAPRIAISIVDAGANVFSWKVTARTATSLTVAVYTQPTTGGAWTSASTVGLDIHAYGN